jgi:hypothetical protein
VKVGNQEFNVKDGQEVPIGKRHQSIADGTVSREHGFVGRDAEGTYIRDNSSKNGTWIKRAGAEDFERIPVNENVHLKPGDEVRLGGKNGEKLDVTDVRPKLNSDDLAAATGKGGDQALFVGQDFENLTTAERLAVIEKLKGRVTELADNKKVNDFLDRSLQKMDNWKEDLAPVAKRLDDSEKAFNDLAARFNEEIVPDFYHALDDKSDFFKKDVMRPLLESDPEKLKLYDDFLKAREIRANDQKALNQAVQERLGDVQKVMDDFADANGLPRIKVTAHDKLNGAEGAYAPGQGEIKILKRDLLNNADTADFIGTLYHEFTHSQQDSLIVRSLVDHVSKTGPINTPEGIQRVQELYKTMTGKELTPKHLDEVIKARNGKPLTPDEMAKARDLMDAFKSNNPPGDQYKLAAQDFRVTKGRLDALEKDPVNGAFLLTEKLSNDKGGTLAKHLFGDELPPSVKKLIDDMGDFDSEGVWPKPPMTKPEANKILADAMKQRMQDINEYRKGAWAKYIDGIHEQEAWLVGAEIRQAAKVRNVQSVANTPEGVVLGLE